MGSFRSIPEGQFFGDAMTNCMPNSNCHQLKLPFQQSDLWVHLEGGGSHVIRMRQRIPKGHRVEAGVKTGSNLKALHP
jgi:hypothetical protein